MWYEYSNACNNYDEHLDSSYIVSKFEKDVVIYFDFFLSQDDQEVRTLL